MCFVLNEGIKEASLSLFFLSLSSIHIHFSLPSFDTLNIQTSNQPSVQHPLRSERVAMAPKQAQRAWLAPEPDHPPEVTFQNPPNLTGPLRIHEWATMYRRAGPVTRPVQEREWIAEIERRWPTLTAAQRFQVWEFTELWGVNQREQQGFDNPRNAAFAR